MRRIILFVFSALFLIISACSRPPIERNYYLIGYNPVPNNPNLILEEALPYRVQVPDSRISRVYDRTQIVFRYSAHRVEYAAYELWAVRLSSAIADALTNHFVRYNTFAVTQRDFLIERPDFEVVTYVNRLEVLKSDLYKAVNVEMDIFLRGGSDLAYLVRHSFARETEVYTDDVEIFVQQLSRIVREENDKFIEKLLVYFDALDPEQQE